MRVSVQAKRSVLALVAVGGLGVAARPAAANAPAGWYTIENDGRPTGTVIDTRTKLTWQQAVPAQSYVWADAVTYCSSNTAGLSGAGWRLASRKELQTLVDFGVPVPGPMIDGNAFPGTPAAAFWSSSPGAGGGGFAWNVDFSDGQSSSYTVGSAGRVRCVR
jgi:hypothetical protein